MNRLPNNTKKNNKKYWMSNLHFINLFHTTGEIKVNYLILLLLSYVMLEIVYVTSTLCSFFPFIFSIFFLNTWTTITITNLLTPTNHLHLQPHKWPFKKNPFILQISIMLLIFCNVRMLTTKCLSWRHNEISKLSSQSHTIYN